MSRLSSGDLVFIPTNEGDLAFAPGCVVEDGGETVRVALGDKASSTSAVREVPREEVRHRFSRDDGSTGQDNTSLVHLNDATILENLGARHQQDQIYTYTASVLLAMNPYKEIQGLYGDEQCERYRGKHIGALPPHPYAIADTAYRALMREQRNQGLLISGESGAGKTETAKIVMKFLAYASGATSDLATRIQARVLQAQPILESFGNAVTMRNSNSSRFGKYNRVFFNQAGTLVDAGITTYLLESSRVVVHGERERTYHCFYEMLSGLDDEKLKEFQLDRNRRYRLMHNGASVDGCRERDIKNFRRLCDALRTVGLDDDAVNSILRVLAGIIHLGDISKDEDTSAKKEDSDDETKTVDVNDDAVERAAAMLGMDPEDLSGRLKRKKVAVAGRNSFHEVPRNNAQFLQALHSLIKALYKRLFEHTVQRINDSFGELRPGDQPSPDGAEPGCRHIGILDIYGFERLQKNSFEQLCINLANERLQQYFVENVLVAEQAVYKREGLPWLSLSLPDSQPVVNSISHLFRILDDYSLQLAKGLQSPTDEIFCQKAVEDAMKDPQRKEVLRQLKMSNKRGSIAVGLAMNEGFVVKHYAGLVEYNTKGWLVKNNDRLLNECEALVCDSSVPFVQSLGEKGVQAPFRSISKKYTADLEALLSTLGTCNLHYIRCFKPNEEQKPAIFKQRLVLDQIIQCGTIELVKIMHHGYPNRCAFEEITTRFRDLLPEQFQRYGMRTFIEALMLAYEVPREEWALGMSRLFLKAGQLRALEDMRSEGVKPQAEALASIVRSIIRRRWVRARHAVQLCQWIPRYITELQVQHAEKALCRATLLRARFVPQLEAARLRLVARHLATRRRLLGAFRTVAFLQAEWKRLRSQRKARITEALHLATWIYGRSKPWVAGAKDRAREAEVRREAERRREEERRRLEEERRRKEQEDRLQRELEERRREEERRLVAERQRHEEEMRQRAAEEQQRLEAERQRHEEERQREEERLHEEARLLEERRLEEQRLQEERRAADEARLLEQQEQRRCREEEIEREREEHRRIAEELELERSRRAALEAERVRQQDEVRAEVERQLREERERLDADKKALEQDRMQLQQERRMSMILSQASPLRPMSPKGREVSPLPVSAESSTDAEEKEADLEEQELDVADSASVMVSSSSRVQETQEGMTDMEVKIKQLEMQMALKHQEVQEQMQLLQRKNAELERKVTEEKFKSSPSPGQRRHGHRLSSSMSPERTRRESLLSLPEQGDGSQPATPHDSATRGKQGSCSRMSTSGHRLSLIDLDTPSSSRRQSMSGGRMDSKQRRMSATQMLSMDESNYQMSGDAPGTETLAAQRGWWAQQRQFLLEDLYGSSPLARHSTTPGRNAGARRSQAAEPLRPAAVAEEEEDSNKAQVNLNARFDVVGADVAGPSSRSHVQDDEGPRRRQAPREAQTLEQSGTKLKQPLVFVNNTSRRKSCAD